MSITNCPSCGGLYVRGPRGVCARCAQLEDDQFDLVKAYLRDNPEARLDEVAEGTDVPARVIMKFIRSGRLVVGRPGAFELACERCGKPINTGVVCPECAISMARELQGVGASPRGSGMHVSRRQR